MKKLIAVLMIMIMTAGLWATAGADIPGVLADFTVQASELTNQDTRNYAYCYYDWDEDGADELFFIQGLNSNDGTWPMNAVLFTGEDLKTVRWSPPKNFKDVAEILTVCMIDIDPADGAKDLVFSAAAPDGTEQTMILQGVRENTDDVFGKMWMDPNGGKILSGRFNGMVDGNVVIGSRMYASDEKYYLKETGTIDPASIAGKDKQSDAVTEQDYAGKWIVEEMTDDEETIRLADYGMEMSIELFEDGTAAGHMGEEITGTWKAENGKVSITFDGDTAETTVEDGIMNMNAGGFTMKLVRAGYSEPVAASLPTEAPETLTNTAEPRPLTVDEAAFAGVWHLVYLGTGGFTGDAKDIGLTGETMTLKDDHTGSMTVEPGAPVHTWQMGEDGVVYMDDGKGMMLLREEVLQYGSVLNGYMIFSRDPAFVWDGSIPMKEYLKTETDPTEAPVTPEPAAVPSMPQDSGDIRTEVRYTAKTYVAAGYEMDASVLPGEYSVVLHDDGTVSFTMAGVDVPGLLWKMDGETAVIDYYGSGEIRITAEGEGIVLDLFGTMTLKMIP